MGAVPSARVVSGEIEELYDYEVLRQLTDATMFVVHPSASLLVLGGKQSDTVLSARGHDSAIRRRRGGGGVVALAPEDLWIDFWIPRDDPRWRDDVRVASRVAGDWWAGALNDCGVSATHVHDGGVEGDTNLRLACFAGRGPGEVFVNDVKAVGVTQWRVREGMFLSTVLRASDSVELVEMLASPPAQLEGALRHHHTVSLGLDDPEGLVTDLRDRSGPWRFRRLGLLI